MTIIIAIILNNNLSLLLLLAIFSTIIYAVRKKKFKMFKQNQGIDCDLMRNWKFHNASVRLIHEQLL